MSIPAKGGIPVKIVSILILACLVLSLVPASIVLAGSSEEDAMKARHKKEEIDLETQKTLERLFKESAVARELFDKAYGYAVFDNLKLSFMVSGGVGSGVAVEKKLEKRTYMNMGTGGIGIGLGGKKYQVVFLFEAEKPFRDFVDKGWTADASAGVVVGKEGVNVQARFVNGIAVYQLTGGGLMVQADIAGTKFWKNEKLNDYAGEKEESGK
jgi:lipid-binding SYLF domain-containing protein